ncbi:transposase [Novosphingobium lubricantis]
MAAVDRRPRKLPVDLQSIIDAFMRHRFGRRSEQLAADQLQLGLEDVEIALGHARAARDAVAPRSGCSATITESGRRQL